MFQLVIVRKTPSRPLSTGCARPAGRGGFAPPAQMDTKIFKLGSQRVKKLRVSVIETTRPEKALEQRCVLQL